MNYNSFVGRPCDHGLWLLDGRDSVNMLKNARKKGSGPFEAGNTPSKGLHTNTAVRI